MGAPNVPTTRNERDASIMGAGRTWGGISSGGNATQSEASPAFARFVSVVQQSAARLLIGRFESRRRQRCRPRWRLCRGGRRFGGSRRLVRGDRRRFGRNRRPIGRRRARRNGRRLRRNRRRNGRRGWRRNGRRGRRSRRRGWPVGTRRQRGRRRRSEWRRRTGRRRRRLRLRQRGLRYDRLLRGPDLLPQRTARRRHRHVLPHLRRIGLGRTDHKLPTK
jgi:hypothetical protein